MKVSTDAILLGAWVKIENAGEILDIGTGTGLISLMLAQRSTASITAIEIETNAHNEARNNFAKSPWMDRIRLFHTSFQRFTEIYPNKFDLIISNPPYFENDLPPADEVRLTAKHTVQLSFRDLLSGSRRLLLSSGRLSVILPVRQGKIFTGLAGKNGLWLSRLTEVKASQEKNPHRWLMEFRLSESLTEKTELIIEKQDHSGYTEQFKELTGDFYLTFRK